jgi:hypothetical protein
MAVASRLPRGLAAGDKAGVRMSVAPTDDQNNPEEVAMKKNHLAIATPAIVVALVAVAQPSKARVVKFLVQQQSSFLGGAYWGNVGPYEMLQGTAYLEVDPRNPRDAVMLGLRDGVSR